jgi:uncharacterized membrane protein YagU involved in acid resistance
VPILRAMSASALPRRLAAPDLSRRVLGAAALVAALDLAYAGLVYVVLLDQLAPIQLPQAIAAGLLGRASFAGGTGTALLGLVLHCLIALGWTLVYLALVRGSARLREAAQGRRGRVTLGLAYGALVWLAMSLVVLPLSRARPPEVFAWLYLANLLQHGLMVGLPIALLLRDGRTQDE